MNKVGVPVVGMGEVEEVLPDQFLAAVADDGAHRVVDTQPGAFQRGLRHADPRIFEGGAKQRLAPAQGRLQAALLAHVAEEDGQAIPRRIRVGLEMALERWGEGFHLRRQAAVHRRSVAVAEGAEHGLGERLPQIPTQQIAAPRDLRLRILIQIGDAPGAVDDQHAIGRALERGPQAALAGVQRRRHAIEGGAKAAELAAVRGKPGAGGEIACAPMVRDPQQPVERAADKLHAGHIGQRQGEAGSGDDQQRAIAVSPVHRGEGGLPVEPDAHGQIPRAGAERRIRHHQRAVALQAGHCGDADLAAFQDEAVPGRDLLADEARVARHAGEDRAIAVHDRHDSARRQIDPLELLRQPIEIKRHHHHAADRAIPVPERPCHVDGRPFRPPAYGIFADDEGAGLQRALEVGTVGIIKAGVERTGRADDMAVKSDDAGKAVPGRLFQQVGQQPLA